MPVRDAGGIQCRLARGTAGATRALFAAGALKPPAQRLPYTRASPPTQRRLLRRRGRRGGRRRRRGRRRRWRRRRWRRRIFLLPISGRRRQTSSRARASHAGARRRDGRSSFYPRSVRHPSHGLLALSRRRRCHPILSFLSDGGDSIVFFERASTSPSRTPVASVRHPWSSHPRTWVAGVRVVRTYGFRDGIKINRVSDVL